MLLVNPGFQSHLREGEISGIQGDGLPRRRLTGFIPFFRLQHQLHTQQFKQVLMVTRDLGQDTGSVPQGQLQL